MPGSNAAPAPFLAEFMAYLQSATGVLVNLGRIPQANKVWPAMALIQVGGPPGRVLAGDRSRTQASLQIDVYSPKELDVMETAEQLRAALHGFRGWMGGILVADSTIKTVRFGWGAGKDGSDTGKSRTTVEVEISYFAREVAP